MVRENMVTDLDENRPVYPHVVASTEMGDGGRTYVAATSNQRDTVVEVLVYWHIPETEGEPGDPVLMIEVDEASDDENPTDINLRIRRNEGLIFEGTRAETSYIEEGL